MQILWHFPYTLEKSFKPKYDSIKWLNFHNTNSYTVKKLPKYYSQQNFYLNNSKLIKTLNIKLSLTKLEKDCKRISKLYFKK